MLQRKNNEKMMRNLYIFSPGLLLFIILQFTIFKAWWMPSQYGEFNNSENKLVLCKMLNDQINKKIIKYDTTNCLGCIASAQERVKDLFREIKSIETYIKPKMGYKSDPNVVYHIYAIISYIDPKKITKELDIQKSHTDEGLALFRIEFDNGYGIKIFSNGKEKRNSPTVIERYFENLVTKIISEDIKDKYEVYYRNFKSKEKTKEDVENEWKTKEDETSKSIK